MDQARYSTVDPDHERTGRGELLVIVTVLLTCSHLATGTWSEITDLDAIIPVQQCQIGPKLDRLQSQELNAAGCALIQKRGDAIIVKLVQRGGSVAKQVILSIIGKNLDGIDSQQRMLECGVMVEDYEVNLGEPVEYARIADQYAIVKAESGGLKGFERIRQSRAGRVVRAKNRPRR